MALTYHMVGHRRRSDHPSLSGWLQVGQEPGVEVGLWHGSDDAIDDLAVLEHDHPRDAHRVEADGQELVVVDVDLDDLDPPGVLAGERIEHRADDPAGAAPWRPKVDDDGRSRLGL